jgi:hypothetical protein
MPTPEFTPVQSHPRGPRWIESSLSYEDLSEKRVFAQFTTQAGQSYEGTGEIRVLRNPEGRLALTRIATTESASLCVRIKS